MPSSLAVALAALLTLSGFAHSTSPRHGDDVLFLANASQCVPIISRPEASDIYISPRIRIGAAEILKRNPELLRSNEGAKPYRFSTAAGESWQQFRRRHGVPLAPALDSLQSAVVPEPSSVAFLSLSALLLLRRRRPQNFGEDQSRKQDAPSPPGCDLHQRDQSPDRI